MSPVHRVSPLHVGGARWIIPPAPSCLKLQATYPPDGGGGGDGGARSYVSSPSCASSAISLGNIRSRSPLRHTRRRAGEQPPASLPETSGKRNLAGGGGSGGGGEGEETEENELGSGGVPRAVEESLPSVDFNIVAACAIGLLTGISVVLFNTTVDGIRDFFWDGIPSRGASFLREEPIAERWQRVILVPVCGGVIVSLLNMARSSLEGDRSGEVLSSVKGVLRSFLKAVAASVTLGTGNSLGPEGPSVEIGASIAKGVGSVFSKGSGKGLSLVAAGSAAGIASEVGLGSDPAFTVPEYDFRSPSELPLYLLLGILCGVISLALSKCTSFALNMAEYVHRTTGAAKALFPAFGGLSVGLLALGYPEVLYWGFENVDVLLESRPFVTGLPPAILFQLIGVKIVATSISRASGLVGGYYAPSLFIGAATGMAYGKFVASVFSESNPLQQLHIFEVASPQAYGLVGMAATLAGVCQVPLTAVLLLFELTHDYRIVLPLLGAVGLSSLISSSAKNRKIGLGNMSKQQSGSSLGNQSPSGDPPTPELCELESSLCVYESEARNLAAKLTVLEAMRTTYVSVSMDMPLLDAVNLMFAGKQPCALIVDEENRLVGLLTLEDVTRAAGSQGKQSMAENPLVSDLCRSERGWCMVHAVTPSLSLLSAERMMDLQGVSRLPVVSERIAGENRGGHAIGLLDRECIDVACRARAVNEFLGVPDGSS